MVTKTNEEKAAKIVRFGFNLMLFFSEISEPFIPETTIKIKNCLDKPLDQVSWAFFTRNFSSIFERVEIGDEFKPIENLFHKIENSHVQDLEQRFRGTDN